MRLIVKLVAGLGLVCSISVAEDWTEFRGPTGQGHSTAKNLPVTWSESENITWKVPVDGIGWSSPVVANDRVYLTTSIGDKLKGAQSLQAICLNASSGKTIWQKEIFQRPAGDEIHGKNSHASPTPVLEGDRLYVHFGSSGTACLQTADGRILWTNTELEYASQHGNGGCPAVADDLLIICCDGRDVQFVTALEKSTGKVRWKTDRNTTPSRGFSFCTPTLMEVNGKAQAICPGSQAVIAYEPSTGQEIWRVDYDTGYSVVPRPVFGHGLVFIVSGFGDQQLLAIDPTGSGDVTKTHVKWKAKKSTPRSPSLLLVGTELYSVDDRGIATCYDAVSGKVHWQERLGGKFSASPLLASGNIYFQSESGDTTVIRAGTTFEQVAKNSLAKGERTFASFAIDGDALLLRSENHLYRIESASP